MAIQNHQELIIAQEKITRLQLSLEEMKTTESARDFQRQAECPLALITGMRREIDAYLSVAEDVESEAARTLYMAFVKTPEHVRKAIQELLFVELAV